MQALDWAQCAAVESVPEKLGGAWVLRGTRLPVSTVFENLEDLTIDEVMEQFDVTREETIALLEFCGSKFSDTARTLFLPCH